MLEIILYTFLAVYALHLLVALAIYMIGVADDEKKAKAKEAEELLLKRQQEDDRIEAMRKEREAAYYARVAQEQRPAKALAATIVMPLVPPLPPKKF